MDTSPVAPREEDFPNDYLAFDRAMRAYQVKIAIQNERRRDAEREKPKEIIYDDICKVLSPSEMSALWTWHHDCELKCAGKGDYDDAKWHAERKRLFWREPNTPP